jgi:hypothetical protein
MAAIEVVGAFVETPYALVLAAILLLVAAWFWLRSTVWPAGLLALLFLLEILYLSEYEWSDTVDRLMIIVTLALAGIGFITAALWLVQAIRGRGAN